MSWQIRSLMTLLVLLYSFTEKAIAYEDLYRKGLEKNFTLDFHAFKSFDAIQEPRYIQFRYGFPPGIYGSSIIPLTIWFMLWGNYYPEEMVPNFGNLLPVPIDWFKIVMMCDEVLVPRCSWAHFINLMQPLAMDMVLLMEATFPAVMEDDLTPFVNGDCYPLRTTEQMSIIHIYAVCTVYWNVTGFDKHICPNPCERSPCATMTYTRSGSCSRLGIHDRDFKCECNEGFYWDKLTFSCNPNTQCESLCHRIHTQTCDIDYKTGTTTCICRRGYMGYDCSYELDACLIGSEVYDSVSQQMDDEKFDGGGGGTRGPIVPSGLEACATEISSDNICKAHIGTTSYSCQCGKHFVMDPTLPYDNCKARRDPCASRICIEGTCMSSENGLVILCDCEDGFTGEQCEIPTGSWSLWSSWTPCEPYCGSQRQRRRIRVCLGDREDNCIGAVETIEFCTSSHECPKPASPDEVEWRNFADWTCLVVCVTVGYIFLLLLLLTLLALFKPSGKALAMGLRHGDDRFSIIAAEADQKDAQLKKMLHDPSDTPVMVSVQTALKSIDMNLLSEKDELLNSIPANSMISNESLHMDNEYPKDIEKKAEKFHHRLTKIQKRV